MKTAITRLLFVTWITTLLIGGAHAMAADANVSDMCANLTPAQKALAKANGYDVDTLCASAAQPTSPAERQVTAKPRTGSAAPSQSMLNSRDPEAAESLTPFGYDLFAGEPTTFAPLTDVPVPADYVLGPGDIVKLYLFGKESKTLELPVTREGTVILPDLGPFEVAGMTFADVKQGIQQRIQKQYIGQDVLVTLGKLRSIRIFVLGEAYKPGSYVVSSLSTISNALFAAGGVRPSGSLRRVQLKRRGKTIETLDLYDLLLRGDTSHDARLQPGDAVFIPPIGSTVAVAGKVNRPAIYELKDSATLQQALELAGGLAADAYPKAIHVRRNDAEGNGGHVTLLLDLTREEGRQFALRNGDRVAVDGILDFDQYSVRLTGHVYREKTMRWTKGLRVTDLVGRVSDLKPNPDLHVALILRRAPETRRLHVVYVDLGKALTSPDSKANLHLQPMDELMVFSAIEPREESLQPVIELLNKQAQLTEPAKVVTVQGAVRFPGQYPLPDHATAKTLVAMAGGFAESADLAKAEITRRVIDPNKGAAFDHFFFNWDQDTLVQSGDTLVIPAIAQYNKRKVVRIEGEVKSPGTYVVRDGETITDLIRRAGGLTSSAYPNGAIFSRERLRQLEEQALERIRSDLKAAQLAENISESNAATPTPKKTGDKDTEKSVETLLNTTRPVGRMVIDLPRMIAQPQQHNLVLEDGDKLYIPPRPSGITVLGQVQYPTSHLFEPELSVSEYIDRSGGVSYNADTDRIFIVKANGRVVMPKTSRWFAARTQLEPGDTIVVPIDFDYMKPLDLWTQVTQIIYQSAVAVAAVGTL